MLMPGSAASAAGPAVARGHELLLGRKGCRLNKRDPEGRGRGDGHNRVAVRNRLREASLLGSETSAVKENASMLQANGEAADGGSRRQRRRLIGPRNAPAGQLLPSPWSVLPADVVRDIMTRCELTGQAHRTLTP